MKTIATSAAVVSTKLAVPFPEKGITTKNNGIIPDQAKGFQKLFGKSFMIVTIALFAMLFTTTESKAQCGYNYQAHRAKSAAMQHKAEKKMRRAKGDLVNFSCVSETKAKSSIRMKRHIARQSKRA